MAGSDQKKPSRLGRGLSSLLAMPAETRVDAVPGPPATSTGGSPGVAGETGISTPDELPPGVPAGLPLAKEVRLVGVVPPLGEGVQAGERVLHLPIDQIKPNPHQPRREFDLAGLSELAASIAANGVLQPVLVREAAGGFELIAGERRLRAAKMAGLKALPAVVREADRLGQAQLALVENIQRADLNPLERAEGFKVLVGELGLTHAELAARVGMDKSAVSNHLRLLELEAPVRELLRTGGIALGHAKVLAGVADPREQIRLAELVASQDLTVRNLERVIANPANPPTPRAAPGPKSAHLRDLEVQMTQTLGLRVQIRPGAGRGRGKVTIAYRSLDEFDALLAKLGIELDAR